MLGSSLLFLFFRLRFYLLIGVGAALGKRGELPEAKSTEISSFTFNQLFLPPRSLAPFYQTKELRLIIVSGGWFWYFFDRSMLIR